MIFVVSQFAVSAISDKTIAIAQRSSANTQSRIQGALLAPKSF